MVFFLLSLLLCFLLTCSLSDAFTVCHCFGYSPSNNTRFDVQFNVTSCAACAVQGTVDAPGCANFTAPNSTIDPLPQCQDTDGLQPWAGEFLVQTDRECNRTACCCPVAPITIAKFDVTARSFELSGAMVGLCGPNGTAISNTTALSNVVVKLSVVQDTYAVVADNADGWPFGAGATLSRSSVRIVVARAKEDQQDCDFNLFVDSSRLSPFLIFVVVMAFLLPVSIIAFFVGRRFWRQRRNYKTIA